MKLILIMVAAVLTPFCCCQHGLGAEESGQQASKGNRLHCRHRKVGNVRLMSRRIGDQRDSVHFSMDFIVDACRGGGQSNSCRAAQDSEKGEHVVKAS